MYQKLNHKQRKELIMGRGEGSGRMSDFDVLIMIAFVALFGLFVLAYYALIAAVVIGGAIGLIYLLHIGLQKIMWGKTPKQQKARIQALESDFDKMYDHWLGYTVKSEKFYVVEKDKKHGIIGSDGKAIQPVKCTFEFLNSFGLWYMSSPKRWDKQLNKGFFIAKKDEKYGVLNFCGEERLPFEYGWLWEFSEDNKDFFIAKKGRKYGVIDLNEEIAIAFEYDWLSDFSMNNKKIFIAKRNKKYGIVDLSEKTVVPFEYDLLHEVEDDEEYKNFLIAKKGKKYGAVNFDEKAVVPFEYDDVDYNGSEKFVVKKDKKKGVVSVNGKVLLPCIYDVFDYLDAPDKRDFYKIEKDGKVGVAEEKSESIDVLLDCIFDDVRTAHENKYEIEVQISKKWYFAKDTFVKEYIREQDPEVMKEKIKKQILEKERKKRESAKKKQLEAQAKAEMMEQGIISDDDDNLREPIPQDVQDRVWNRDGGKCVKCGSQEKLEFDHIIPFSRGGSNTYRNLQILCEKCNRSKSNKIG